jgi:hypothetical protein
MLREEKMFKSPKYKTNSFNIVFPRHTTIRRKAAEFEDKLKGFYFQPQVVPVPDELDPEIPRIIFGSEHGYSQIIISQVSIVLNVFYSEEWQSDIAKGNNYLDERVAVIFGLLDLLEGTLPYFCGLSSKVQIASDSSDKDIISHLARIFLKNEDISDIYDLQIKHAKVEANQFFSNITLCNYRTWKIGDGQQDILRLPNGQAFEKGIEIIGDFNDRYIFNENNEYRSNIEVAHTIIEKGLKELNGFISHVGGAPA